MALGCQKHIIVMEYDTIDDELSKQETDKTKGEITTISPRINDLTVQTSSPYGRIGGQAMSCLDVRFRTPINRI